MTAQERVLAALRNPDYRLRSLRGLWDEVGHDVSPEVVETVVGSLLASGEAVLVQRTMVLVGLTDRAQEAFPTWEEHSAPWWGAQPTDPEPGPPGPVGL